MIEMTEAPVCPVRSLRAATSHIRTRPVRLGAILGVCALILAGCASSSGPTTASRSASGPGGGDGINDAALGVAASPIVATNRAEMRRGGGRDQVGRPYRIAGRLYTPREDPNYDRTGIASWYGPGFHGRLTANGEVFDQYALSAAHPTLPLPSYVRVTNLANDHSVIVRVNDRGPFAHDRIIDLSKRAADVLAMRQDGVGRVRVEFVDRAPLHGQDVEWLEASIRVPGQQRPILDTDIVVASAPVPAPVPGPSPVAAVAASVASAFVATNDASTLATGEPLSLAPASTPAPTFAPAAPGTVPGAPVPSAIVGFTAMPVTAEALADGFVQRSRDANAHQRRIDMAHVAATSALDAAEALALQSQTLNHALALQDGALPIEQVLPRDSLPLATIQIGLFGDAENVQRLQRALARHGQVVVEPRRAGGRTLSQVQLQVRVADRAAAENVLRVLAGEGYTDAYLTSLAGA